MADHRVRVIFEALDRGSANARKFFQSIDKDVSKLRGSMKEMQKQQEEIFLPFAARKSLGYFDKERSSIERATTALIKFKQELRGSVIGSAAGGLAAGLREERLIREEADRIRNITKEQREEALADFKEETAARKNIRDAEFVADMKQNRDRQTAERIASAAFIRDERLKANAIQDRINIQRKLLSELGLNEQQISQDKVIKELRQQRDEIEAVIQRRIDQRKATIDAIDDEIAAERRLRNAKFDNEREAARRLIARRPNEIEIDRQARENVQGRLFGGLDGDIDRSENRLRRFGLTAGRAFGQFRSGIALGRNGLSDIEKQMIKTGSAAQRLGARIGDAGHSIRPFRGIVLVLIGALQIFGTLVVQAGAALVALASSAILAGAALGGALLAGLTQVVPVVGLLAAAFSRLGEVMEAVNIADKLKLTADEDQATKLDQIKDATQRLADARWSLARAAEAVKDSEYELAQAGIGVKDALKNQSDAIKELAEARKQAAQDIVDANLEEKEAALALREAELGILDAKRRLREEQQKSQLGDQNIEDAKAQVAEAQARLAQARAEGDEVEITVALQQLNQAEQSLQQIQAQVASTAQDVEKAKIDVKQAELNQQQAAVRNRRAREEAESARRKGVSGSDVVKGAEENLVQATRGVTQALRQQVLAQRALRDSIHAMTIARREERDAEEALTDSRKKQTAQQEQLQNALGDLSPAERKLYKSIQRIKEIYKKNFRPITDIIISSFSRAIDTVSVLFKDPVILKAARQLATAIAGSIDKLAQFAVTPEFRRFLEFSLKEGAKNVPKITDAFINLFKIVMRIATAAAPIFDDLIDRFDKFTGKLEKGSRDTKGLEGFFASAGEHLDSWIAFAGALGRILGLIIGLSAESGKGILDDFTAKLNEWSDWLSANGPAVREFFADVRVNIGKLGNAAAKMAVVLFKAFKSDTAVNLSVFILDTLIPAFALFLQLLGLVSGGLIEIFKIPVIGPLAQNIIRFGLALLFTIKLAKTLIPLFKLLHAAFLLFFTQAGRAAIVTALAKALGLLAVGIRLVGVALRFVFITNPWIAVIAGIIAAVVLLDRKFHFIRPTIEFLGKLFRRVFDWVKRNWKLLTAIILGPFGLIIIAVVKWHDKIIGFFKTIINWVKQNWKTLIVAALLAPFAIGGVIILGFLKFKDKIINFFKNLVIDIVKEVAKLPGQLAKIFAKIPGLLKDALKGLGGIVVSAIEKIPGGKRLLGAFGFGSGAKSDEDRIKDMLKDPILDKEDRAKVNRLRGKGLSLKQIITKLAADQGITVGDAEKLFAKYAFASGGTVPGMAGAVPIIAHAGEWVLNKMQQSRLASRLGMTSEQAAMWLFGTNKPGPVTSGPPSGRNQAAGRRTADAKKKQTSISFGSVRLVSAVDEGSTDEQGNPVVVWFVEMDDGTHGQVSERDAAKIKQSNGTWVPGYVKRSSHGFTNLISKIPKRRRGGGGAASMALGGIVQSFANGGIVQNWASNNLQSFAEGGTVMQQSTFGAPGNTSQSKNIEQNFNVTANHETDWNYVLRLGAIHAQASYT